MFHLQHPTEEYMPPTFLLYFIFDRDGKNVLEKVGFSRDYDDQKLIDIMNDANFVRVPTEEDKSAFNKAWSTFAYNVAMQGSMQFK